MSDLSTTLQYDSLPVVLSDAMTLSLWIKTSQTTEAYLMTIGRTSSTVTYQFSLRMISNGKLNFWDYSDSQYGFLTGKFSEGVVNTGELTHIAFVKDGLTGTYYINGVASGTTTSSAEFDYSQYYFYLGGNVRDKRNYLVGDMTYVQVFKASLSAADVLTVYQNGLLATSPTTSPTMTPTVEPTVIPTSEPTMEPTVEPTLQTAVFEMTDTVHMSDLSTTLQYDSLPVVLSDAMTLSLWIKTSQTTEAYLMTIGRTSSTVTYQFSLRMISNGKLNFWDYSDSQYGFLTGKFSEGVVNTGELTHIAFVKDGLTGTYYINGVASGTTTSSAEFDYSQYYFYLGGNVRDKRNYLVGDMTYVQVFKASLSAAEVLTLYQISRLLVD